MRIIQKTYFLLAIIIAAASINIFLLLTTARENESDSNAVISATDLKVMVERVNTLANSIARGNEADRQTLMDQLEGFEDTFDTLRNGGQLHGKPVAAVPDNLRVNYEKIGISWNSYKQHAQKIEVEPVFNLEVKNALAYVLEKNGELAVTTNKIVDELSELDRNYNKHKEIAMELEELAKSIGENTLRISIGEGENLRDEISKDRILFEANLRKLLQIPLTGLETGDLQIE
ncbi:MAG TPA: type IV pili methyl-accepting chemotaxis transducer N-terminal domain-containing protein, partial [Nitrosopumilaceae archaeon]|nr:type IV pili methyl-accepting chemotaxis transducer N-terminal domain-containing protein [Nitrosopumilaceae archaeon]